MQFMDNSMISLRSSILVANPEWHEILSLAINKMDKNYLQQLNNNTDWLPKLELVFKAFSQPLSAIKYILLGESPYPRQESANGFAFWDNSIDLIWSSTGLSKSVNRATSLRNFIKMLLYARGDLKDDFSQSAIAKLDKSAYLQTIPELFQVLLGNGFLLLNASLIYSEGRVLYHAKNWRPFMDSLFEKLFVYNPLLKIILLGRVSKYFAKVDFSLKLQAEHPYNISFITNAEINSFFKEFDLLGVKK